MLIVFVCFELGFTEYGIVVPVLTIAGVVILEDQIVMIYFVLRHGV